LAARTRFWLQVTPPLSPRFVGVEPKVFSRSTKSGNLAVYHATSLASSASRQQIMTPVHTPICVAILLSLSIAPGSAGPLQDAQTAYESADYPTALRLFRSLAVEGNATAQSRLGMMYERGLTVPQDYALAAEWYRRAADQGDKIAQFDLAVMFETGYGVQQNYVQAHMWYNLSAAQGWGAASLARSKLEKAMTPAQIAEAQKLAREWKPK
jgi:TPR repeat protein